MDRERTKLAADASGAKGGGDSPTMEAEDEMKVDWTNDDAGLHTAECVLGEGAAVHLLAEGLGEYGWDWQMWDPSGYCRMQYGVADTLEEAKALAEFALLSELVARRKRAA